jgi:enoyl-CoA hydratase/carnithine racemase
MTFRDVLTSMKLAYSLRPAHKTLRMLLGEAAIGLVPEEEGAALLVEAPDNSRSNRGQRCEVVKGRSALLERETDNRQSNTLRGCVPDRLSVYTVF